MYLRRNFDARAHLELMSGVVMPFGLKNVGATYQRAVNSMFHDFIETFMQVYIDDIVIKSSSENGHLGHL